MTSIENKILNSTNISSDKIAAAAISHIYKAYGDFVRSKELWPFSEKNNLEWEESQGLINDCNVAINFIEKAINKYEEENEETEDLNSSNDFVKSAKNIIKLGNVNLNIINETTNAVNTESNNVNDNIDEIISNE